MYKLIYCTKSATSNEKLQGFRKIIFFNNNENKLVLPKRSGDPYVNALTWERSRCF